MQAIRIVVSSAVLALALGMLADNGPSQSGQEPRDPPPAPSASRQHRYGGWERVTATIGGSETQLFSWNTTGDAELQTFQTEHALYKSLGGTVDERHLGFFEVCDFMSTLGWEYVDTQDTTTTRGSTTVGVRRYIFRQER